MSSQTVPDAIPKQTKGGRAHGEIRDTAHPLIVTELLAGFMLAYGEAVNVASIRKHTRDEVLWNNCKKPWRRSPVWLLVKVSIHLIFLRTGLAARDAVRLYKHFMISFTVCVLSQSTPLLRDDPFCTE